MREFGKLRCHLVVPYHELDDLIHEEYGRHDWEYVAAEEVSNGSSHQYDVNQKKELDRHDLEELELFRAGNGYGNWATRALLQDLVNRDVIPPAVYLVEVSW